MSEKIIIPQSDFSLIVQVDNPYYQEVRNFLLKFAIAQKTPEHIHIYKIDAVSLWNAAVLGLDDKYILNGLTKYCQFTLPYNVNTFIQNQIKKYGTIQFFHYNEESFIVQFNHQDIQSEITGLIFFDNYEQINHNQYLINKSWRGKIKAELIEKHFPVEDLIGYTTGDPVNFELKSDWQMRDYQKQAVEAFWCGGGEKGGAGVVVLACGGGKTVVGIGVMQQAQTKTLIITTTENAALQFKNELLQKTTLTNEQVGIFSGKYREIRDITITTYFLLTYRVKGSHEFDFKYVDLFEKNNWGLIIYDEVHILPAPIFSFSTQLQSKRRLGLTATLVREDNKEHMIFGLIGPKRYDLPWKELEMSGNIAVVTCVEIRIDLDQNMKGEYYNAQTQQQRFKIASTNLSKQHILLHLLKQHKADKILIIGEYISQLEEIHNLTDIPIITGKINTSKREILYQKFRDGQINALIVSRVANFAIDLPDANVLIQVSGLYGSRQEEAQRLGRILRPKAGDNKAVFYSIVTQDTVEIHFVEKRQMFLIEQGYNYEFR